MPTVKTGGLCIQSCLIRQHLSGICGPETSVVKNMLLTMATTQEPVVQSNTVLPGYEAGPEASGVEHSHRKLEGASRLLKSHVRDCHIQSSPCAIEADTWAYRCRCTFQIVRDEQDRFQYAMRHKGTPIHLGTDEFPIATRRIQAAMKQLMEQVLNTARNDAIEESFYDIQQDLTSCTFSSAWNDVESSDCIITLYYDQPLEERKLTWERKAGEACKLLGLRQLYGRSKGSLLSAINDSRDVSTIRDTVLLTRTVDEGWDVVVSNMAESGGSRDENLGLVKVHYEKPETAFYHPNAHAMTKALRWMLERISTIIATSTSPVRLLEMYCGCGAHTVALGKTGMLQEILAIELDQRLVEACITNVRINNLDDTVQVAQGDAGTWAKREYKWSAKNYSVLLVDPPRAGLDNSVCQMAKGGTFEHFLYISCGHKALLRDLERLSDVFEVVHCHQLDLFPRTDSIETLVHLQRKTQQ